VILFDRAEAFGLDDRTRDRLASSSEGAAFNDQGRYIHVTTYARHEDDDDFKVGLFESTWLFYVVVGAIVAIGPVVFALAKRRAWI
jgi:hypothetical protein